MVMNSTIYSIEKRIVKGAYSRLKSSHGLVENYINDYTYKHNKKFNISALDELKHKFGLYIDRGNRYKLTLMNKQDPWDMTLRSISK